jgi:hypothetical protein
MNIPRVHYSGLEALGRQGTYEARRVAEDFVWATSEEARLRAMSVYMIRSIVEKYSGTMEVDSATDTISISVPKDDQFACLHEIQEQLGTACL